ncbi:MAG TPA: XdhC family protein [Vicinamibacterales bacterium]|nr:XdhC family protein [Vicinamibacterales bacterium]
MNRRETERILGAIRSARQAGQRVALATIVRVRGSAYRREGARILVRDDGSYECLLSGGCLEPAVAEAAARVISTGTPVVIQYDLEEDSVWSVGIGCSGAVDIYIERVDADAVTAAWLDALGRAEPAVLVRRLPGGEGRLLVKDRTLAGTLGAAALDGDAAAHARERLRATWPESGTEWIAGVELFFEVSDTPPELVIFGAGSDAEPLVRYAWDLGFAITVVDVREAFLSAGRFPHASLVSSHFSRFQETVRLTRRSFVVIMNHHLERDRESLRFAVGSDAPYIGVLGPQTRFQKLTTALDAEGFVLDAAARARVRSPVDLALGAETPEEIALSILGEMIALQRGFDGGFLAGRAASLHRSRSSSAFARS